MPQRSRSVLALAAAMAVLALGSACSSGHGHHKTSPKAIKNATPAPTPSGPCQISATVTCQAGVLPVWTADVLRSHLLEDKDVRSQMSHPYDASWWGITEYNQYLRRWAGGNYVPACHFSWIEMNGPTRVVAGHNLLWSDYGSQYPHWPQESITQYAYVYTDPTVEAHDINAVWNNSCDSKHIPYLQLLHGYFVPPEKDVDQSSQDVRAGWAHKRIVEKRYPDNTAQPEQDVFDFLQKGNVLIVNYAFEQYTKDPAQQDLDRTLSDVNSMLDRQVAKLQGS